MTSLIRKRQSDEKKTLSTRKPLGATVPQDESYLCLVGPRTTDVPHPGASIFISSPRSKQLGHLGLMFQSTKLIKALKILCSAPNHFPDVTGVLTNCAISPNCVSIYDLRK